MSSTTNGLKMGVTEEAPEILQMVRARQKVTSIEAAGYARCHPNPAAAFEPGCYCVWCFCGSIALPVTCACVFACNGETTDMGLDDERGLMFIHGCKCDDPRVIRRDDSKRACALLPIDEAKGTLGCWLMRDREPGSRQPIGAKLCKDPCCYCYRMPPPPARDAVVPHPH